MGFLFDIIVKLIENKFFFKVGFSIVFILTVLKCEGESGGHKPPHSEKEIGSLPNFSKGFLCQWVQ